MLAQAGPWGHMWGWTGGWMLVAMVLVWAAIAGLIAWLTWMAKGERRDSIQRAEDILADRYARGEVSTDEYRERLRELESARR